MSLPTLRVLSRRVPSTSQYSSPDPEPLVEPTTSGRYLRSAPSMNSQVSSVSENVCVRIDSEHCGFLHFLHLWGPGTGPVC